MGIGLFLQMSLYKPVQKRFSRDTRIVGETLQRCGTGQAEMPLGLVAVSDLSQMYGRHVIAVIAGHLAQHRLAGKADVSMR